MNLKMKVLALFFVLTSITVLAQEKTVTGTVKDDQGSPLPGVTVVLEGTTQGTITNLDGYYTIKTQPTDQLKFSYIGFKDQLIIVGGQTVIDVVLEADIESIEEVIVVGYGVQKKESVVASITQTKGEDLEKAAPQSNLMEAISGTMPGVIVLQQTGLAGQSVAEGSDDRGIAGGKGTEVLIRAKTTWNSSVPLILVDGIERGIEEINANEVEAVSVLKDASATAVYGVRGANGVILVTTKRGKEGKPKLSFEANLTSKSVSSVSSVVDSYTGLQMRNYAIMNDINYEENPWSYITPYKELQYYDKDQYPVNYDMHDQWRTMSAQQRNAYRQTNGYPSDWNPYMGYFYQDVDFQDQLLADRAWSQKYTMNVSGGTKFVKYYGSIGYIHEGDILATEDKGQGYDPDFKYDRLNFRSNLDFNITKSTLFSVNLAGHHGMLQRSGANQWSGLWQGVYTQPHDAPVLQYPDGTYGFSTIYERFSNNPVYALNNNGTRQDNRTEFTTDFHLKQDLDFLLKGLSVKATVSFDNSFQTEGKEINDAGRTRIYIDPSIQYDDSVLTYQDSLKYVQYLYPGDFANTQHGFNFVDIPYTYNDEEIDGGASIYRALYYSFQANYANEFGRHEVTALALMNRRQTTRGGNYAFKYEDWVGRATYNYDKRYFAEFNGAYTGSQLFNPEENLMFQFFPSVALGWTPSNEAFFKENISFMNTLKFRYSYGVTGNDKVGNINDLRWQYIKNWNPTSRKQDFGESGQTPGGNITLEGKASNPVLQWEISNKHNIGAEIGIFQNLLSLTFDYWMEKRSKILVDSKDRVNIDYVGTQNPAANIGAVEASGIEIEAKFSKAYGNGFRYWAQAFWTNASDKITKAADKPLDYDYRKAVGYQIGQPRTITSSDIVDSYDELYTGVIEANQPQFLPGDFRMVDFNSDGIVIDNGAGHDGAPYGYPGRPKNTYGLSLGSSFKGFELFVRFSGMYNINVNQNLGTFHFNSPTVYDSQINDTWVPELRDAADASFNHFTLRSGIPNGQYNQIDASHIRLRSAEISYTFAGETLNRIGLSRARVFINGNNLWRWSKIEEDRETGSFDRENYPVVRRFNYGVNITF